MAVEIFSDPARAVSIVQNDSSIMFGGFVSAGSPSNLIMALHNSGQSNLTLMANNIGLGDKLDLLCESRQVSKVIATFAIRASGGRQSNFEQQYHKGEVGLELVPQGTFAERIRAGGAGIGGFLTPTGVGTMVAEGKEIMHVKGKEYLLELPLRADYAFIKAYKADTQGNLVYRGASKNFNELMATAADCVIAEVEQIVEVGSLRPSQIHTPGIFVDRVVQCDPVEIRWE
ncbi:MAG: CoA transferase subunit A [Dehalococcoidia bacterium]|nr:CoA transferase subunit A [Dehalococcoidia bacterium]